MNTNFYDSLSTVGCSVSPSWFTTYWYIFWPLLVWALAWKGLALWKAGGLKDKVWFVVLLVVNTAGILDILYLYVFSKKRNQ